MRLITLLAGYAAGLAVAMKYRKDSGASKIEVDDKSNKTKVDSFIDEIVDIHKTAFDDVKGFVSTHFDDVNDFESLKSKAMKTIDAFSEEAEALIESLKNHGDEKKEEIESEVDALFEKKNVLLEEAKKKGSTFSDVAFDVLSSWIDEAKAKLESVHTSVKMKIDAPSDISSDVPTPKKKTTKTTSKE